MTRIRKIVSLAGVAALLLTMVAGPTAAQEYPPDGDITLSSTNVTAGGSVTVSAPEDSFEAGSEVGVTVGPSGQSLGGGPTVATLATTLLAQGSSGEVLRVNRTITAAADGSASVTIDIPENTRPGRYTVTLSGTAPDGSAQSLSSSFTVVAAQAQGRQAQGLASTGANTGLWLGIAAAVALLGGGMMLIARRRRSHSGSAG